MHGEKTVHAIDVPLNRKNKFFLSMVYGLTLFFQNFIQIYNAL